jgi:hypothetical protein
MSSLFDLLHQSHETQRTLCRQLTATRGDTARREPLFLQLKVELKAHAAAEERFLYVPLLMTDAGLSASRHALSEHHRIEELCEELSVVDKSGAGWLECAKELGRQVRHHLKEEESKFFKVAGRILDAVEKDTLARRYQRNLVYMRKKYADELATLHVNRSGEIEPALETGPASRARA